MNKVYQMYLKGEGVIKNLEQNFFRGDKHNLTILDQKLKKYIDRRIKQKVEEYFDSKIPDFKGEKMECYDCIHAHISTDMTGGDELISIVCEHDNFHMPKLLIHSFKDWLDTRPDDWRPKKCPKGDDE